MKTVRKLGEKEIKISIRKQLRQFEEALPSFFHVATIVHQYHTISELKNLLTGYQVLMHIDYSENYSCD